MSYTTISIEGGLFPPDLLERISLGDGGIKGQATGDFGLPLAGVFSTRCRGAFRMRASTGTPSVGDWNAHGKAAPL